MLTTSDESVGSVENFHKLFEKCSKWFTLINLVCPGMWVCARVCQSVCVWVCVFTAVWPASFLANAFLTALVFGNSIRPSWKHVEKLFCCINPLLPPLPLPPPALCTATVAVWCVSKSLFLSGSLSLSLSPSLSVSFNTLRLGHLQFRLSMCHAWEQTNWVWKLRVRLIPQFVSFEVMSGCLALETGSAIYVWAQLVLQPESWYLV